MYDDLFNQKPKQTCCQKYSPLNRFMFLFCRQYEVDKGWGCGCCGCRAFPFSFGVIIFGVVMLISSIKDFFELANSDYIYKKSEEDKDYLDYLKGIVLDEKDDAFIIFFRIKNAADVICILAAVLAFISIYSNNYCISVNSYYLAFLSFVLNSSFLVFVITRLCSASFWSEIGITKIGNVFLWFGFGYVWLLFTWFLFCNMVNIKRKKEEEREKNQYNYGGNYNF